MSVQFYPNGIGGTVGDSLDTCKPLLTTGNVWYVNSVGGVDAAAPAGQNREKPLATLAQAVTNALDDDIIVFLQGHTQTLLAGQAVAKRLTFIGEGTTAGKPGVSFIAGAAITIFSITAAAVELRNIYFPPSNVANTNPRVLYNSATDGVIRGCYFECGATDTSSALRIGNGSARMRLESNTFISTATSVTAQPTCAIDGSGALVGLNIKDLVVSSGTVGFSNYAAVDFSFTVTSQLKAEGISLLLGADMALGTSTTGRCNVQLATGGSRVQWS